jgi:hypothetical protein
MKLSVSILVAVLGLGSVLSGRDADQDALRRAQALERDGDALGARALYERTASGSPDDAAAALRYAEFLDRYREPGAKAAYEKAGALLKQPSQREERARVSRRLVLLDLIAGDRAGAGAHLEAYRAAGGTEWAPGLPAPRAAEPWPAIEIPGPLRSFARMAALSSDGAPDELLPALARNVVTEGYTATRGEALEPTEYLKLVTRYLSQARELARFAGEKKAVVIEACDSPQTGELLRILGYRMRGGCGSDVVLETVNAGRAFLTIDSGFPIAVLEQALRTNRRFTYEYAPTSIPLPYGTGYWLPQTGKQSGDFIDVFLGDPILCRAFLGLTKLDRETADALRQAAPLAKLEAYANVLDFFGAMFEIRNGRAVVPGGARSEAMWAELVGAPPAQGAAFFDKLISRDDGWMASYFDALARLDGPVRDYLTEPQRMKRFYLAVRGRVTSPGPARPVFRSNTAMTLLTTRLRLDADGRPHIPGGLEVWKNVFGARQHGKYDARVAHSAGAWKDPDDVIEALFGLCRKVMGDEPLQIFMTLSDLDGWRARPFEPATVARLAEDYRPYGSQYPLFTESPALGDRTILQYLDNARAINRIGDLQLRADTAGAMQALAGLWQIFCRQGSIPASQADAALAGILAPFARATGDHGLFDAGRSGVKLLLKATGSPDSAPPQARMMELLAGATETSDSDTQAQVVQEMVRLFDAQRLTPLDALFDLADNLESVSRGQKLNAALVNRMAARIADIQPPRANLTGLEMASFSKGYWAERHIDVEHRLNLRSAIDRAAASPERLRDLRGLLAPFLRDALVGLNYVYYAPPGAQILLTNPTFVRGHDFIGMAETPQTWKRTAVTGSGWPSSSGGRLMGSLAALPDELADAEQNFLVPTREQALIWTDLVPELILSAKVPRWWSATPAQMHWVGLHMRYGESLVAEAALDPRLREQLAAVLARQAPPARVRQVAGLLERGEAQAALALVTPCELLVIARGMIDSGRGAPMLASEIRQLGQDAPARVNYDAISSLFGTPKPALTGSYRSQLLYLRTMPALMGYSSRIMAESWESTTLYWVALADELHVPPSQLNVLIPEWTRKMVERIFATHLEDWPALLRSLRQVGEDVRAELRPRTDTEHAALQ